MRFDHHALHVPMIMCALYGPLAIQPVFLVRSSILDLTLEGRGLVLRLAPFVPADRLKKMVTVSKVAPKRGKSRGRGKGGSKRSNAKAEKMVVPPIGKNPGFINADLRPYQQRGINWILAQ